MFGDFDRFTLHLTLRRFRKHLQPRPDFTGASAEECVENINVCDIRVYIVTWFKAG